MNILHALQALDDTTGCSSQKVLEPALYTTATVYSFLFFLYLPMSSSTFPLPCLSYLFFCYLLFLPLEGLDSTQVLQRVSSFENGGCSSRLPLPPSASLPLLTTEVVILARHTHTHTYTYTQHAPPSMPSSECSTCYSRSTRSLYLLEIVSDVT